MLPALALNYLGQGALVLSDPTAIANPFYRMVPSWALYPMIALATAATVIASQAVITGAFSLTNQAVQLGLLPRLQIRRTSETQAGQIYIPRIRGLLLVGTILLVVLFRSSNGLASAYGVAVAGTMLVDGVMAFIVVWRVWKWALWAAMALMVPFIVIDFAFFGSNLLKVLHGGWVPLLIGVCLLAGHAHLAAGSEYPRRQNASAGDCPSTCCSSHWRKASLPACPAPPCSSPRRRRVRPPRCCTASSTTRFCMRAM